MAKEIVKVQRPLAGGRPGIFLVYAEGRKKMQEQPIPPAAKKAWVPMLRVISTPTGQARSDGR